MHLLLCPIIFLWQCQAGQMSIRGSAPYGFFSVDYHIIKKIISVFYSNWNDVSRIVLHL